ncbi:CopG family transcriptional regulator [Janibacter melonis]|uniref:CopG family transcriptional regulator n=1 Tax=Janibacter melonis TaxID=262209 RepID=UPI002042F301|nr:CopG family transcriptional regulator [Janibacter melonis]MCM3555761.1 CopG family transcriptional regulator [Janibacter melonis]
MRTTVTLSPDIQAEVDRLRRDEGLGTSEAVNLLARRGLAAKGGGSPFVQRTAELHTKVDVSDIGAVLDLLDEP